MKKMIILILAASFNFPTHASGFKKIPGEPDAYITKIWADHDVIVNGRDGMRVHFALTVREMKGKSLDLQIYVMQDNDVPNNYIKHAGIKDTYHTDSGYLSAMTRVTPTDDFSNFKDVSIFLPYDEFQLNPGTYDLIIDVFAIYPNEQVLGFLDYYEFEFTAASNSRSANNTASFSKNQNDPVARCDSMWVDFDITENSQIGMHIHFRFQVDNMKDSDGYVFAKFQYGDGRTGEIKDQNGKFNTNHGGTATWAEIKPRYDESAYDNFVLFMPYSELELKPGKYQLIIDSNLILKDGTVVANFPFYTFDFTKAN